MKSVMVRIMKQVLHDRRSLAMIVIAPIFLLTLLYLLLGNSSYVPAVAADGLPQKVVDALQEQSGIRIVAKESDESNEEMIRNGNADAVITQDADGLHILMMEPDSVKTTAVSNAVKAAFAQLNPQAAMEMNFLYGDPDESAFNSIGYLLVAILSFFMIFIFSGISFVRERTSGTVERLMLTPVKTVSVVLGYILGFGVFALIQSMLLILFSKFVFQMPFAGQWWMAAFVMLLIAVIAVMFGILVSAVSKNEFQVMQFIPVVVVPQFFFTGIIPVDTLPYHLSWLSKIMPLYYGSMGLRGILIYGSGLTDILPDIFALFAFIAVLFAANIFAVKKYRAV